MTLHWTHTPHPIAIKTKLQTYGYLVGEKIEKVVISMHGFGDNAQNASHIAQAFHLEHVLFLFVQGPQNIPISYSGFQWFDLFHESHKSIDSSANFVLELFHNLTQVHNIPSENIYFMGFSQGAAMALYVGLSTKQKIGGIVSLSGFIVQTAKLLQEHEQFHKNCPILLMHGDQDQTIFPVLFFEAQELLQYMKFNNVTAKLYPIGHTVCPEQIEQIKKFFIHP